MRQDSHAERGHECHGLAADVAQPDYPDAGTGQAPTTPCGLVLPPALPDEPILDDEVVLQREDHRQGRGGDGTTGAVRCDRHRHASGGAGPDVDAVEPDPEPGHEPQSLGPADRGPVHSWRAHHHGVQTSHVLGDQASVGVIEEPPADPHAVQVDQADVTPARRFPAVCRPEVGRHPDREAGATPAAHRSARGLTGDPVPPGTTSGATTSRNS